MAPELPPLPKISEIDIDLLAAGDATCAAFIPTIMGVIRLPTCTNMLMEKLEYINNAKKEIAFPEIEKLVLEPSAFEVSIITTKEQLSTNLNCAFRPLLIAPKSAAPTSEVIMDQGWTIEQQLSRIGQGSGDVFSLDKQAERRLSEETEFTTLQVKAAHLRRVFNTPEALEPSQRITNALNIANTSGLKFQPPSVNEHDLVMRIESAISDKDFGRGEGHTPTDNDWMLLTSGPVASGFHTDQAGYCTFVTSLEGEKWWLVAHGDQEQIRAEYLHHGAYYANNTGGVSALIQPPGTQSCRHQAW